MPITENIDVNICYELSIPDVLQLNNVTAKVNVIFPDRAHRIENTTLVSFKVPVGRMTHGVADIIGHFTLIYDYDPQANTIYIHKNKSHITTVYVDQTCHVYTDGECSCSGPNWSICGMQMHNIAEMFQRAAQDSENSVWYFMERSAAGYTVQYK